MELGINIAWNKEDNNISEYYFKIFKKCKLLNISVIRIILSQWGINALYDENCRECFDDILKEAEKRNIEIILTLTNFVDFNNDNSNDINNDRYSWKNNKYYTSKKSEFFKSLNPLFKKDIKEVLKIVDKYHSVKTIELCNEIDKIEMNKRLLIKWSNLLETYIGKLNPKYNISISISNHKLFRYYQKKLEMYVDLHHYSFPYNIALLNLKYIIERNKKILYLGEYSKYSDMAHSTLLNSKIYFTSGLWGSYFYNLKCSNLSWWWDEIIDDMKYKNIYKIFSKLSKNIKFKELVFTEKIKVHILKNINDFHENQKVKARLMNLIKHPKRIFKEFKNIYKYIIKKLNKQKKYIEIKINEKTFYFESYHDCSIELDNLNNKKKYKIINLIDGNEIIFDNSEQIFIKRGNYLIIEGIKTK